MPLAWFAIFAATDLEDLLKFIVFATEWVWVYIPRDVISKG